MIVVTQKHVLEVGPMLAETLDNLQVVAMIVALLFAFVWMVKQ